MLKVYYKIKAKTLKISCDLLEKFWGHWIDGEQKMIALDAIRH